MIFIGVPMLLVSLQAGSSPGVNRCWVIWARGEVDLCLPYNWMFPQSAMIGLLVCGGGAKDDDIDHGNPVKLFRMKSRDVRCA